MPVSKFGLSLKVLSDVYCRLPYIDIWNKHKVYYHLATVQGGTKEYVAYLFPKTNQVWIEEVYNDNGTIKLRNIEDDNEFNDIRDFLYEARLLEIGSRKEIAVSKEVADILKLNDKPSIKEV